MLLAIEGHEVHTRADGVSGIAATESLCPDVVLLDIGLPDLDGYEVARQLRQSRAGCNVTLIAVTGMGCRRTVRVLPRRGLTITWRNR
jgi:two-component system CheB/CheR fusion protein